MGQDARVNALAPVVVLRPATAPGGSDEAWETAWAAQGRMVQLPDLSVSPGLVVLESPGLTVLDALSGAGAERAVLCGSGYGAMVALHLAANHPDRVAALVLTTASRLAERERRGIADAAYGLLPVSRVQQLKGPQRRVLELLDQVRTVDWTPFAARVEVPSVVVLGERDAINKGPSRRLTAVLPRSELVVVPGAKEGWVARDPSALAEAAAPFLAEQGV
jgi:pimeloyl-ACP methyl ester carboxylesterase